MALHFFVLCLSLCYTTSLALTTSEKQALLDLHNELRDRVAGGGLISEGHPAATDMNMLIWDDGLAELAQNYLNKCVYQHNNNREAELTSIRDGNPQGTKWDKRNGKTMSDGTIWAGENLAANSNSYTIERALKQIEVGWFNEYKRWQFGPASLGCESGKMCSHYTQMVWANTRYVGCAWVNDCDGKNLLACNYFPLGNMNGKQTTPYTAASSASQKASNCMNDRTIHGHSQYQNVVIYTAGDYDETYNALCGGGACATQCAGDSWNRNNCDECSTDTDCNDGTTSLTSGRDICGGGGTNNGDNSGGISCSDTNPFACKDGSRCIIEAWVCDDYKDCADNSDESDCGNDNNDGDNTDNTDNTDNGSCDGCYTAIYIKTEVNGDYCKHSSNHNGKEVYANTNKGKAMYWTGRYWYIWNWSGSTSNLDDDSTISATPDAYCGYSSISDCNGNWHRYRGGEFTKKTSSSFSSCSAMEVMDCMAGYDDTVCTAAHDTNNTGFIFGSEWELSSCHNDKPMYYALGYYLLYEERAVYDAETDTKEILPFWMVSDEEGQEYAYCNEHDLSECSAGLWYLLIQRPGFVGYEVDDTMAMNECVVAINAMVNNNSNNNAVVLAVLLLVSVAVFCLFCVIGYIGYRRLRNTKRKGIVDDYQDTKKLAQNDEMQEVDGTQMLQEIEVEIED